VPPLRWTRSGRRHRRAWVGDGKAHIEVRTATRPGSEPVARHLEEALARVEGVHWAEVNAVVGRVVVAFDGDSVEADDLIEVIEEVEEAHGAHRERFGFERPDHPGDREPARRALAGLVADVAGIGLGAFGAVLQATPIPIELATLVSLVDNEPRLRRVVENALGAPVTDVTLATVNAAAQGLAQGPLGLVVDGLQRATSYTEATARRRRWELVEAQLHGEPTGRWVDAHDDEPRPVAAPGGPVETFTDRAAIASLAGAATAGLTTGNPRTAAAVLMAGVPKAAKVGRETFAAHLGRLLADRGVVVTDSRALRRLDTVDTVCIEAELLLSGAQQVEQLELLAGADHVEVRQHLRSLFDPTQATRVKRRPGWAVGPVAKLDLPADLDARRAIKRLPRDAEVIGLVHGGHLVAVFSVADELALGAVELVDAAQQAQHMVAVAGGPPGLVARVGADLAVDGGTALTDSIRGLQTDGCVVLSLCRDDVMALGASDVGVGVAVGNVPVWGGHVMVFDGLTQAAFVIEAAGVAHEVSRQSAAMALLGSSAGSLLAVAGGTTGGGRALTSVNVAALLAIGNSTRAAWALSQRRSPIPPPRPPWHELEPDEVLAQLGATRAGLSAREALARRGPVARTVSAPFQFGQAVAGELANPLVPVLAGGAALSAMVGSTADAAVIGAVTGANALLGAAQRFRAERAVRALDESHQMLVTVLEGGRTTTVSAEALVRGSVISVDAGSVIGADARLLEANGLEVDESTLTGESLPVTKDPAPCFTTIVAERTSMLYEGTTVVAGSGTAVVVATGRDTEAFADIGPLDDRPRSSGVDARLARLSAVTLPFAALGGLGVIGAGLVRGQPLRRSLGAGVSLAVAAVPEGLPMLATVAQLSAARRLSVRGALVRNPRAIEALGRVEVLCTDKTGTLTHGRISLQTVSDGSHTYAVDALNDLARAIVAAGRRASPETAEGSPLAHPTDQAIVDGAVRVGAELDDGAPGWSLLDALPFEPSRGYHATLGSHDGGGVLLSVKGAPETVLTRCTARRGPGGDRALTPTTRKRLERSVDELARRGLRVLAVAEATLASDREICDDDVIGLVFLGFLALADPVRPSAAAAVDGLRRAGVEVVMVTGDHPSTAEGIAAELGILNGHRVMTGGELQQLDDAALAAVLPDVSVFARVTPADKVRIVRAYQASGIAVAMTGDGANDAPAIRLADAGLALGANATAAARDAADVIITDERIETIVDAIIEGRAMWASVREALAILLGGNLGEIAFTVAASGLTGRTPLSSRQLLLVNMLTDVAPSMAIAVRPPRNRSYDDLAAEGPDRSLGASLNRAIALRAVTTAAGAGAAWGVASLTGGPKRAGTVGLVSLVGTQLGQTLASGGMHPSVLLASVGSAAVLVAIVQTPGVSQFFGCTPLDPLAWATAAGAATTATALAAVLPPAVGLLRRSVTPGTRELVTPTVAI